MSPAEPEAPEPDRVPGAPHPRETAEQFGQEEAEAEIRGAIASGRMHHAWLLTGPRGIGKATLAWRIARSVLAGRRDVAPEDPLFRRLAALSEPRLALIRRGRDDKTDRLRTEITVAEIRRLNEFLRLSAVDGGWRVILVDAAEEMNQAAANALLKLLEEPPARVLFLMVSHQPARLLPTIRSRCRVLRLAPLGPADLARALAAAGHDGAGHGETGHGETGHGGAGAEALAELSSGSVGEALRLAAEEGPQLYAQILGLLAGLPRLDRPALSGFAESLGGREAEGRRDLARRLVPLALARIARAGATGCLPAEAAPGETALALRLAPGPAAARGWADASQRLALRMERARAVNLDPAQVMLDTFLEIEETARRLGPAA